MRPRPRGPLLPLLALSLTACPALLVQRVQAPRFEVVPERPAELRILAPTAERPIGALAVRLWGRVSNPNPFALTLLAVRGDLLLEGTRAAEVDFPLGIPLPAAQDTVIPFDVLVDPRDAPGIAPVVSRALLGQPIAYEFVGRVTVDAGMLGRPTDLPSGR